MLMKGKVKNSINPNSPHYQELQHEAILKQIKQQQKGKQELRTLLQDRKIFRNQITCVVSTVSISIKTRWDLLSSGCTLGELMTERPYFLGQIPRKRAKFPLPEMVPQLSSAHCAFTLQAQHPGFLKVQSYHFFYSIFLFICRFQMHL